MRGYCGIGIVGSKTAVNVGTLWRSAAMLGAGYIFTAGKRFPKQASDTVKTWKHVPMFEYPDADALFDGLPYGCVPVAIELDPRARPLAGYNHPERACYILGAEDNGLPAKVLERCRDIVVLPGPRSLNVAVAGSIVLYDRLAKADQLYSRRVPVPELPCGCIDGWRTRGVVHESWCPSVTGNYDGLPRLEIAK